MYGPNLAGLALSIALITGGAASAQKAVSRR